MARSKRKAKARGKTRAGRFTEAEKRELIVTTVASSQSCPKNHVLESLVQRGLLDSDGTRNTFGQATYRTTDAAREHGRKFALEMGGECSLVAELHAERERAQCVCWACIAHRTFEAKQEARSDG